MPLPSEVHVNAALSNFSVRYSPGRFIARRLLPTVPVPNLTGSYFIYGKENLRDENTGPMGARSPANERGQSLSEGTYSLGRYTLKDLVLDETVFNADPSLDPKQDTVAQLMDNMYVDEERAAAALLFSTSNISNNTTLSGTSQWSDFTNGVSDPIGVIETAKESVQGSMRVADEEMTIAMGSAVWRKVRNHPGVVARFQYTSGGGVTRTQFAELCGIEPENLLVGASGYVTSDEGQTTVTTGDIWGKHCLVAYVAPAVGLRTRTLGVTFAKSGGMQVFEWRNNDPEGDWVRPEEYRDQAIIDDTAAYLVYNAVA